MPEKKHRFFMNERGGASIEFAFSLVLFLFLAFGIIEFGSILNERNAIIQLVREGASLASRNLTTDAKTLQLLTSIENPLDLPNNPSKYKLFLATVSAGTDTLPNPTCNVAQAGGLSNSSVYSPAASGTCDLPMNLYNMLIYNPANGRATVSNFTVVKAYYEHDSLTPVGNIGSFFTGSADPDAGNPTTMTSFAIF